MTAAAMCARKDVKKAVDEIVDGLRDLVRARIPSLDFSVSHIRFELKPLQTSDRVVL